MDDKVWQKYETNVSFHRWVDALVAGMRLGQITVEDVEQAGPMAVHIFTASERNER